jgi:hypothetical protein
MKRIKALLEIDRTQLPNARDQPIAYFRRVLGIASQLMLGGTAMFLATFVPMLPAQPPQNVPVGRFAPDDSIRVTK